MVQGSALEAWQPSKMTSNLPKLGLISFLSLSRTQKTVCPKIPKIWDALFDRMSGKKITNPFISIDRKFLTLSNGDVHFRQLEVLLKS